MILAATAPGVIKNGIFRIEIVVAIFIVDDVEIQPVNLRGNQALAVLEALQGQGLGEGSGQVRDRRKEPSKHGNTSALPSPGLVFESKAEKLP